MADSHTSSTSVAAMRVSLKLYGGKVDRVGKDGPRVNPFALEPTESSIKFLYSFVKLLLTNGGAELEPEDDDVIHKAVQDMYLLDAANRRLSNLFLPKKLDRYLAKWVGKGIYNAVFDNVEDSLSLSRLQCFDFQGVNNEQYADLIEPLMVWAATSNQRRSIQPRQSRSTEAHPHRRDLLFDEEQASSWMALSLPSRPSARTLAA